MGAPRPGWGGIDRFGLMRRRAAAALLALATGLASAAGAAETTTEAEVRQLLDRLATSGCRFERNGRWHDGVEARAHLASKLAGARSLGRQGDTEAFIEQAASRSSMTGRPYRVACGDAPPQDAGPWLRAELAALRRAGRTAPRVP